MQPQDMIFWVLNYDVYAGLIDKMLFMEMKNQEKPIRIRTLYTGIDSKEYDNPQLAVTSFLTEHGMKEGEFSLGKLEDLPDWSALATKEDFTKRTGIPLEDAKLSDLYILNVKAEAVVTESV